MHKLDTTIFILTDRGEIRETTLRDVADLFVETTTAPIGVAEKYHLRGNEVWTWGHCGNFPRVVSVHKTEEEAQEALDDIRYQQYLDCNDLCDYATREEAEEALNRMLE